eukprot:SAG31_NODE_95_length_25901_cov_24.763700_12_plen_241_part_00
MRRRYSDDELQQTVHGRAGLWEYLGSEPFASEYFERKPVLIKCEDCALAEIWPLETVKDGFYTHEGTRTAPNMRFIRLLFTNKLGLPKQLAPASASGGSLSRPQIEYALDNGFTLQAFGTSLWCACALRRVCAQTQLWLWPATGYCVSRVFAYERCATPPKAQRVPMIMPSFRFPIRNPNVAALCSGFGQAMQRHCSANLYVTPPSVPMSLRPHNDYQCVFIVQVIAHPNFSRRERTEPS